MDHIDSVLASLDLFSDLAENLVRLPAHFAEAVGQMLTPLFLCRSLSPLSVPKDYDLVWLRVCTGRLTGIHENPANRTTSPTLPTLTWCAEILHHARVTIAC